MTPEITKALDAIRKRCDEAKTDRRLTYAYLEYQEYGLIDLDVLEKAMRICLHTLQHYDNEHAEDRGWPANEAIKEISELLKEVKL